MVDAGRPTMAARAEHGLPSSFATSSRKGSVSLNRFWRGARRFCAGPARLGGWTSCFPYSLLEISSSFREPHIFRRLHELAPEFWRRRIREPQIFKFIEGKLHFVVTKTLFEAADRCSFSAWSKRFRQLVAGHIQMLGGIGPASF